MAPQPSPDQPVDAAFIARLLATDPAGLRSDALLERMAEVERALAVMTALQQDNLLEFARRPFEALSAEDPARFGAVGEVVRERVGDEVAVVLHSTANSVERRLSDAIALVRLPVARTLLREGRIDLTRARVLVDELAVVDDATAAVIDARVSPQAPELTPRRLRERARRAVLRADAKATKKRCTKAKEQRRVRLDPRPDGMAELTVVLPAVDGLRTYDVLTAAAKRVRHAAAHAGAPEQRSLDQIRADLFADVFRHAAAIGQLPSDTPVGAAVELQVHAHATTLLGLDDEPGLLAGYGPITAAAVRELEPTSRLRRLLVEPHTGKVLDVGTTSYQPTAQIARHVRALHPRCTFPTCEQPARRSELDHVLPYPLGPTSTDNLRPRCKRHHLLKHHPEVTVEELDDDTTRWTLPTGAHDNRPEPLLPPPEPDPAGDSDPELPPF